MSGDGYASPIAGGDGALVREQLRSPNYSAGVAGWIVGADGSAEFNDVIARGTLIVGDDPGSHIAIEVVGGLARSAFHTASPAETGPGDIGATISNSPVANQPYLTISSNEMGFDSVNLRFGAPTNAGLYGWIFVNNSTSGTLADFQIDGDVRTRLFNGLNLNVIGSTDHSFQLGGSTVTNLAFGSQEIQARNNGAASTLFLNRFGAATTIGGGLSVTGDVTATGDVTCNDVAATGVVIVGSQAGLHTVRNSNQVYAANGASVNGDLYLNHASSGRVFIGQGGTGIAVDNTDHVDIGNSLQVNGGQIDLVGMPTGAATTGVHINQIGGGDQYRFRRTTSSRRYKDNIADLLVDPGKVLALTPRTFQRNDELDDAGNVLAVTADSPRYVGFIAEEADELGLHGWVQKTRDGVVEGFSYELFTVAHQVVLRHHQQRISELEHQLAAILARPMII